jgi:membrane protein insertase, YidC/Oxa1 family, C-terminal domain
MEIFSALGTIFNTVICYPLGAVIKFFFTFTSNYALLLLLFTVVVRFLLFPLAIKQQRSQAEMLRMKPKMEKLQKKYAKDKVKQNEEMQKLYAEEGYSPLSGCLPMLIQLPILYGLYQVVYYPLTYIMWYSNSTVNKIANAMRPFVKHDYTSFKDFNDPKSQLYIAKEMGKHMDKLGFLGHVKNIDFTLFGIKAFDLSDVPHFALTALVLIPILCYVSQALSSWLSFRMNRAVQAGQPGAGGMNMTMVFLMPLMSVWFSLSFPAAVGFYWILSNTLMIGQVLLLQKFFGLERLATQAQLKAEKRREGIANGTVKPSRMERLKQQAVEMQRQQAGSVDKKSDDGELNADKSAKSLPAPAPQAAVKVNSKGNKSRSQLKDEQRRRLAESRKRNAGQ